MGINALCIQSGAFSQLCTQSVCALLYALSQYVLYALNQLCTQSLCTQSVCALRTQSACALRTQSACALRTQSACALRTQSALSIQDKPSSYAVAAGGPLPEPSAVVVETDVLKESLTMGVPLIEAGRKAIVPPTKERNITMSNSYAALDDESEEDVENVYDELTNLFNSTKTGESSSTFTVVVS
ncbi:hypothetical protein Tco_1272974 [Tanacetum coccineum]